MIKKVALILGLLLAVVLLFNFSRQIYDSLEVSKRVDTEANNLAILQKKNSELKRQLAEVNSLSFLEQQARDKLGLARSGETVVIIPPSEIDKVLGAQKEVQKVIEPYWQGWLKLFVK